MSQDYIVPLLTSEQVDGLIEELKAAPPCQVERYEPLLDKPHPESDRKDWACSTLGGVPRPQLPEDDATRASYPMAEGCLDYFPNALAEVSRISYEGNLKHNPDEPMHWNRHKSLDHRNKIIRHTVESKPDTEAAIEHAAQAAWRALAELQQKIERVRGMPMSPGSRLS